jgi:hypothetical protein
MKKFTDFFDDYLKKVEKSDQSKSEMSKGEKVEQEHVTPSKRKTKLGKKLVKRIVGNHLDEDPVYYSKLEKIHKD